MPISSEAQALLRECWERKEPKARASVQTGIAEATVYRYYAKWDSLQVALSATGFDLNQLHPRIKNRYLHEATNRNMSVFALIFKVLSTIADDNMFEAVLDIAEDNVSKKRLVKDDNPDQP